jgi:hypothetical protein
MALNKSLQKLVRTNKDKIIYGGTAAMGGLVSAAFLSAATVSSVLGNSTGAALSGSLFAIHGVQQLKTFLTYHRDRRKERQFKIGGSLSKSRQTLHNGLRFNMLMLPAVFFSHMTTLNSLNQTIADEQGINDHIIREVMGTDYLQEATPADSPTSAWSHNKKPLPQGTKIDGRPAEMSFYITPLPPHIAFDSPLEGGREPIILAAGFVPAVPTRRQDERAKEVRLHEATRTSLR